ncbi:hypothetical protein PYCC9005_004266 [Savitreella phatthalungensis]
MKQSSSPHASISSVRGPGAPERRASLADGIELKSQSPLSRDADHKNAGKPQIDALPVAEGESAMVVAEGIAQGCDLSQMTARDSQGTTTPASGVISLHEKLTKAQKMSLTLLVAITSTFSPMSAVMYVPAIPTIANDLNKSIAAINLSVTSYMLFQGVSPSIWGSLTDVLGRRPIYLITFVVYLSACLGLAFTTNYAELIVFRCLQSTGSASTIAIGAGVIGDITNRKERGGYIGIYSAGTLVGNAIGPILGGIFAQTVGWHGIFYFLVAAAGLFAILLLLILPETLPSKRPVAGQDRVNILSRPLFPLIDTTIDPASIVMLPSDLKRPKVDIFGPIRIMFHLQVFLGLTFTALYYLVWQASLVALSSQLQRQYGFTEIQIGLAFIANGVGSVAASLVTGKILNHDYLVQKAAEEKILREAEQKRQAKQQTSLDATDSHASTGPHAGPTRSRSVIEVQNIEKARLKRIPLAALVFIGTAFAFGWCLETRAFVGLPIIWTFCISFCALIVMASFSTIIVDWYPGSGASATAAMNLARCVLGAGGVAVVQPMIDRIGVGWTFSTGGFICVACLPMVWLIERMASNRLKRAVRAANDTECADANPANVQQQTESSNIKN